MSSALYILCALGAPAATAALLWLLMRAPSPPPPDTMRLPDAAELADLRRELTRRQAEPLASVPAAGAH
jgi:hypothetical protein